MTTLIGVDCATVDERTGVALGEYGPRDRLDLLDVRRCTGDQGVLRTLAEWISRSGQNVTVAIDAPLGWPVGLAIALASHRAGVPITIDAHSMFRRQTDNCVQKLIGITPLDVGADRIARTAHTAVNLLGQLRAMLSLPIPLAWSRHTRGVHAIEVYPAATLKSHGWPHKGYKKREQLSVRTEIIGSLERSGVNLRSFAPTLEGSADALDAVVCLVAARDCQEGSAVPPEDGELATREGWIWVRDSTGPISS